MKQGKITIFGSDIFYERKYPGLSFWLDIILIILFVTWLGSRFDPVWGDITLVAGIAVIVFNHITTKIW